ncbi:MAG: hypothetical protein HC824_16320 [Synechococcales cyanobacterium RM1_1_8]|nr:hypothetical protein [Synechococcales cyanobacterium RM1_1_8]
MTESSPGTATASADSDAAPTPVAESSVTQSANADPFRDAVNAATQAAELAQIASSSEDWNIIAQHWTDAVDGMKAVSSDHPRYDVAQQKISEYQRNLDYALRLAAS